MKLVMCWILIILAVGRAFAPPITNQRAGSAPTADQQAAAQPTYARGGGLASQSDAFEGTFLERTSSRLDRFFTSHPKAVADLPQVRRILALAHTSKSTHRSWEENERWMFRALVAKHGGVNEDINYILHVNSILHAAPHDKAG
jgi:hypothetical protein